MEKPSKNLLQTDTKSQKLIIVTGFGPFIGHEKVNASWEAVRLLPDVFIYRDVEYIVEKQMVPVEYAAVDEAVAAIWSRQPELVIHCGVHGVTRCVLVEKLAYNHKFLRADYAGKRLANSSACLVNCGDGIGQDVLRCGLNVDKIIATVAENCACTPGSSNVASEAADAVLAAVVEPTAKVSMNVGNYLCGYIYLKSLDMNAKRTLFVHVPPIDKPFSSPQTSDIVLKIIEECVCQIVDDITDTC